MPLNQGLITSCLPRDAVRAACIAGVGIAMLTYWDVHEQIERGELKRIVLTDVEPLEVGIWAVFQTRTQMPARVRAFIDALRDRLLAAVDAPLKVTRRATRPGNSRFKAKPRTPA